MKKTYFVGDMIGNTGPANVNKAYYPYLKNKMYFCFSNNKFIRTVHYLLHILCVKNVIISGFSTLNLLLLKIAKMLNKKTFYIMHGFVKEEVKYNLVNKEKKVELEYELLKSVNKIICVSERFSRHLKNEYKEYGSKIIHINNGVNISVNKEKIKHDKYCIISVGGGIRQKNNLKICDVIEEGNLNVKYIVIGKMGEDGEKIKKFPFVEYYEYLSHDDVLKKMCASNLYIQNSYFETFGLAVMEALECGCDLMVSNNIGALDVIDNISDNEIIYDNNNNSEILKKIKNKMLKVNNGLTYKKDECSSRNRAKELLKIIDEKE